MLHTVVPFNAPNEPGSMAVRSAAKEGEFTACPTAADDIALMAFTSGTTGKPKAAVHTHRDVLAACECWPRHVLRATPDDIVIGSPPLAFTFGLGGLLVFPMWAGSSVYFPEGPYTPEGMVKTIHEVDLAGPAATPSLAYAARDYEASIADAQGQANRIIEDAKATAESLRADILAKAEAEAAQIVERAHGEVAAERDRVLQELRTQVGTMSVELAARIVEKELDDSAHEHLVDEYIQRLSSGN